jgi:aspartyl-tRNA(Asn)/glutamyl-tRNA(Gln) amidotransferase subunit C
MPPITRDDAARIAALAKLEMTGDELDRAARDLASILEYFEALGAVDTAGIAPSASGAAAPLREDEPNPSLDPSDSFANAPDADREAGVFRVPRVLGS